MIGENGNGKSTLINLILGLHLTEYGGSIAYNNKDIHEINLVNLRTSHIGVSEQEPILISGSIKTNLTLFKDCSDINLDYYMNIIGLKKYVDNLPDEVNTLVNENANNLSGGEKQKISIIRLLIKNPDVMIFDEPTTALDNSSRDLFKKTY